MLKTFFVSNFFRFFNDADCSINESHDIEGMKQDGYVKSMDVTLHCRNMLESNAISTVLCDKHCYDPDKNFEKMKGMKAVPVPFEQLLTDRDGKERRFDKPVACKCVFKRANKCAKNKTKI